LFYYIEKNKREISERIDWIKKMEQWVNKLGLNVCKVKQRMQSRRTSTLLPILKSRFPAVEDAVILQVALQTDSSLIRSTEILSEMTGITFEQAVTKARSPTKCCSLITSLLPHTCDPEDDVVVLNINEDETPISPVFEIINTEPTCNNSQPKDDVVVLIDQDRNHIELPINPEVETCSPYVCTDYNKNEGFVNSSSFDGIAEDGEDVVTIKLILNDNIYRFKVNLNKFGLKELLCDARCKFGTHDVKMKYKDEEGDYITVSNDLEWIESLHTQRIHGSANMFKFYAFHN